jgi:hypothetical protein
MSPTLASLSEALAISSDRHHSMKLFKKKKGRDHWRDGQTLDTFVSAEPCE